MRRFLTCRRGILVGLLLMGLASCVSAGPDGAAESHKVFVVRHAEKQAGSDPQLTALGQARAEALADLLVDQNIEAIWSSDTTRTRNTAQPLADRLGLVVMTYDPFDLDALAALLKSQRHNALVVGHSNTIAETVTALGADAGAPVGDDEFDRLYTVEITPDAAVAAIAQYGPEAGLR